MVAGCATSTAPASSVAFGHDHRDLLPDLVTAPVAHIYVQHEYGLRLLRLSHEIVNVGRGPFEIHPVPRKCGDQRFGRSYGAQQWIYEDVNGDGRFERNIDTQHESKVITCLIYHPQHHHWHIDNFVRYDLFRLGPRAPLTRRPIATSGKVSFCVVDTLHERSDLPGSPASSYFLIADQLPGDCKEHTTLGLSVGYGDIYDAVVVDQWIPIDGVPNGRYCLVTRTDYKDFVPEMTKSNNDRHTVIALRGDTVRKFRDRTC